MKHLFSDPELSFNQIVFENRNKQYGAYYLRTESNRILTKALFLSITVIAGFSLTAYVISHSNKNVIKDPGTVITLSPVDIDDVIKPNVVVPPVKVTPPAAQNVKTFNAQVVTPSSTANDSKLQTKKPDDAVAGIVDNPTGAVATTSNPQTNTLPEKGDKGILHVKDPVIAKPKVDVVGADGLSVAAKFDGGLDAFRNKVMNRFHSEDFTDEEVLSTVVTFVVEKNGTISNVKASGKNAAFNREAIRTVMEVKGKWTPGIDMYGDVVRSYFTFPVKMKFDQ